jgi:hypothetical protein
MNAAIFSDMAQCIEYVNWHLEGMYHLNLQGRKSAEQ